MTLGKKSLTALTVASIALVGTPAASLAATSGKHATRHAVTSSVDRPGHLDKSRDRRGSGDRKDKSSQDRQGSSIDRSKGKSIDRSGKSIDRSGRSVETSS